MNKNHIERGYDKFVIDAIIGILTNHEKVEKGDIISALVAADGTDFTNHRQAEKWLDGWLDDFNVDDICK